MAILAFMPAPAGAALHDRDCLFPASPFGDAADTWTVATVLVDWNCTGELRATAADTEDWYRIPLPAAGGATLTVSACPQLGIDTALNVYLRPAGFPLPANPTLPPGVPLGLGVLPNACELGVLPGPVNSGGELYIHVHNQNNGGGLYTLTVA
jgi:hypothetical protein